MPTPCSPVIVPPASIQVCMIAALAASTFFFSSGSVASNEMFGDRKSTRLNSSHSQISYAVFCLKKKTAHEVIAKDATISAGMHVSQDDSEKIHSLLVDIDYWPLGVVSCTCPHQKPLIFVALQMK